MQDLPVVALWTLMGVAAVWDVSQRRIPNPLILIGLLLGVAFGTQAGGFAGLGFAILGAAVGLALLILPFHFRLMGGGDVKLAMVAGAFLGWRGAIEVVLVATVLHGLIGLAWLAGAKVARATGREVDLRRGVPHALAFALATVAVCLDWISLL